MANRLTIDHKNTPHRTIAMPAERSQALRRAATILGVSGEVLISRFIDAGLAMVNPPDKS